MEEKKFNEVKYKNDFNNEHYDRVSLMLPKGMKSELKQIAAERGYKSVNALILAAIEAYIAE